MNNATNITCPKCGAEIALNEAVSHQIREEMTRELEVQRREQTEALARREAHLQRVQTELDARSQSVEQTVRTRLEGERRKVLDEARQGAEEALSLELKDLRNAVASQKTKLQQAQEAELELRKEKRQLAESQESLKLDLARQLDAEREAIANSVRQQFVEIERLKVAEKEEVIKGLQNQIEILRQRAEQGSTQLQGETLEVTLEIDLRRAFPYDEILEIKKGERGADVMQKVRTNAGLDCGAILWEAKRARNWTAGWLAKVKEDQRAATAEQAVLVATCLPEGVRGIGQVDGVWVCEPGFACILAALLRHGLIATAVQRSQESGREDKMTQLYNYLCGVEFRQHIDAVVESFLALREQLAAEQRAFARQWKEREEQISKAIQHTAMVYGSIQGIAGRGALPEIQSLQLPGAPEVSGGPDGKIEPLRDTRVPTAAAS